MPKKLFCLFAALWFMAACGENLWPEPPFVLNAKGSKLLSRTVLEPRQRYLLEFSARSDGATVENSPALDTLLRFRFPKMTPIEMSSALLIVNDADNKNSLPAYLDPRIYIHSGEWQSYKWEFYAPDTAKFLNIRFAATAPLEVKDINLRKVAGAGTLNINPDLGMNQYHFPGYGNLHRTVVQEDGSLNIGGWTICDPIPVEPGDRLNLTVEGEAPGGRLLIRTNFYRSPPDDKNFISRNKTAIAITGARKTIEYLAVAPPEARWLRLSFSTGTIYSVKLERTKE
jgi:hypothetical protein